MIFGNEQSNALHGHLDAIELAQVYERIRSQSRTASSAQGVSRSTTATTHSSICKSRGPLISPRQRQLHARDRVGSEHEPRGFPVARIIERLVAILDVSERETGCSGDGSYGARELSGAIDPRYPDLAPFSISHHNS